MSSHEYCPGCDDIVDAGQPCECVFVDRGTIDAQGVLHTAERVRVFALYAPNARPPQRLLDHAIECHGSVAWVEDHGHVGWQVWEPRCEVCGGPGPFIAHTSVCVACERAAQNWRRMEVGEPVRP